MAKSSIDQVIRHIVRWSERPEWASRREDIFLEHTVPACEEAGVYEEDLFREISEAGYGVMLFGMMFEDFLTRELGEERLNVVDDYLVRRGWRESPAGRRYLQALRGSVLSLYEVVNVVPGRYCEVRDLVRGGKSLRIHERSATQNLVKWDTIAARIVSHNGKQVLSGGILPFPPPAVQDMLRVIEQAKANFRKESRRAGEESDDLDARFHEQVLPACAPMFTAVWLTDLLDALHAPAPSMVNRDGDPLRLTEVRYPVKHAHRAKIIERLDSASEWRRSDPDRFHWSWQAPSLPESRKPAGDRCVVDSMGMDAVPVDGVLRLEDEALILFVNSQAREKRAGSALENLLQGLVGKGRSNVLKPEDIAESPGTEAADPQAGSISVEATQVMHQMMDQHYRRTLDEPVPALDGMSPRQAAADEAGREMVIQWLKDLENSELHRACVDGHAPYDSAWIWEELKLPSPGGD